MKSVNTSTEKEAVNTKDAGKESTAPKNTAKPRTRKGLKLPKLRKIHLKPGYIVLGVFAVLFIAFFARVAIWEHNYIAAMEGSERDVVATTEEVYDGGEEEIDDTEPTFRTAVLA